MSINFFVVNGPTRQVQDIDWDGTPLVDENGQPVMYSENEFEINMANANARFVMGILGYRISDDGCGEFTNEELPELRRRIILVMNSNMELAREATEFGGELKAGEIEGNVVRLSQGMRIVDVGLNASQVKERLSRLYQIAEKAQEINSSVVFC